jgi:L-aminopeptidase/D-esterase-like protein
VPGTTLAIVATDAPLSKEEAKRLALMAQGGLARALRFSHAPMDGDNVFAVSTKPGATAADPGRLAELGAIASDCLARQSHAGVYAATALPIPNALPAWRDRFGSVVS